MLKISYFVRPRPNDTTWTSTGHSIVNLNSPLPNVGDYVLIPKYDVSVELEQRTFSYDYYPGGVEVSLYMTYDHAAYSNVVSLSIPLEERERALASV